MTCAFSHCKVVMHGPNIFGELCYLQNGTLWSPTIIKKMLSETWANVLHDSYGLCGLMLMR